MNIAYTLHYEVPATTKLEAIFAASALLRTGVRVEEIVKVAPTVPGWWAVVLDVNEDGHATGCPAKYGDGDCDE